MASITKYELDELERFVDRKGLAAVLTAFARIAELKAEHVLASYDDATLAQKWQSAANVIAKVAGSQEVQDLSDGYEV